MLRDDGARFRAPDRVRPRCSVATCDREAITEEKGWRHDAIEMPSFRLCAEHEARWFLVTLLYLGDAHAIDKWKTYTDALGDEYGWGAHGVLGVGPGTLPAVVVCETTEWRCARCGGGLLGSRANNSWMHKCDLTTDQRKDKVR